jgi:hypothetical protein
VATETYLDNDQTRVFSHYQVEFTQTAGEVSVDGRQAVLLEISKRKILSFVA